MNTHSHRHAVQFYEDSASLCRRVAHFLAEGLTAGEPAVMVATAEHEQQILGNLAARHFDVDHARRSGDLVLLDIEDTLGAFMVDGTPNSGLFHQHMGTIFNQVSRVSPGNTVRAYGEMVDLLWKAGRTEAAITLEMLWNALASKYTFSLLCGYAMGHFYKQPDLYARVCAQHDAVIDLDTPPFMARPA
jgi:DcmR-like sensory protein